jgi:rod shape-determining protein MreD
LPVLGLRGILRRDVAAVSVAINEPGRWARDLSGRSAEETTRPMTLLLAAVGAVVTALIELSVVPYLRIGDAQPHPVLVLGVILAIAFGVEAGLVWAFVGGLALDVLALRPLGSTAFALLLCVGATALLSRGLAHLRPIVPIVAVFLASLAYSMILYVLFEALGIPPATSDPLSAVFPSAVYDAVLGVIIGPLTIAVHDRRLEQERVDW